MRQFRVLRGSAAFFNAPGEGGGGVPAAAPAPPAPAQPAAGASPSVDPAAAPPASGGDAPPQPGQAAPDAVADYWPEGLDPSLKGADAKATLDNLAKTVKGFRDAQAAKGVPDKPEGYTDFSSNHMQGFKIDPALQPHFDALKTDPVFADMAKVAHSHGLGQKALAEIYQTGLMAMGKAGMLEPVLDVAAEKAALVPDSAKHLPQPEQEAAVQKRMEDNYAFLDLAVANMGMPKDVAQYLELQLGDAAKGHQAIEWIKDRLQAGGGTQPGNIGQPGGGDTRESIRAEQARVDAMPLGSNERKTAEAALDERRRRLTP